MGSNRKPGPDWRTPSYESETARAKSSEAAIRGGSFLPYNRSGFQSLVPCSMRAGADISLSFPELKQV